MIDIDDGLSRNGHEICLSIGQVKDGKANVDSDKAAETE